MNKRQKEPKTETITIRCTRKEKDTLRSCAQAMDLSISDYVVSQAMHYSSYLNRIRRTKLNSILVNTSYKADKFINELYNSDSEQVDTKMVIDRLQDIVAEEEKIWLR